MRKKNSIETRTDCSCLHIVQEWRDSKQERWLFVLKNILADFLDGKGEAPLSPSTSPQGIVQKLWVNCFAWEKWKEIEGQRLAAGQTRGWEKDLGREVGEDGNKPEPEGEYGQQETVHQGEWVVAF